jgi:2-phospho-L-lactate guanylyltransferase
VTERIVAVIPIRSLREGKTRLAPVLAPEARRALVRQTAERVVRAAVASGVVETTLVVSADAEVLDWSIKLGPAVVALPQPPDLPGLNGAIEAGRDWARAQGAGAILSLFADLPLLSPEDIRGLAARPEAVVLGSDRRGEGTNALLLRTAGPGHAFRFAFGEGSLQRHVAEAARLGLDAVAIEGAGIGFDLDTPDDWAEFLDAAANDGLAAAALATADGACAG